MSNLQPYKEYPERVLSGEITACKYVKLACKRYLNYFNDERYYFDIEEVERVVRFISKFKHSTGKFKGKNFKLLPFQFFAVCSIYGWKKVEDNSRLVRTFYFEVARKNAKSSLCIILLLYEFFKENQSQCVITANSHKQAKDIYEIARNYLLSIDPKGKHISTYRDSIKVGDKKLIVLGKNTKTQDGLNLNCAILDEVHEMQDEKQYNVITSSMVMRDSPLLILATTAGFNKFGFCYDFRTMCIEVLNKFKQDDTLFPLIYTLDEDDDFRDSTKWQKSNPSLGEIVKVESLQNEVKKATNNTSLLVGIKTKNFNVWCDTATTWLSNDLINESTRDFKISDFDSESYECYAGIDLGSTSDLTCVSYCFKSREEQPTYHFYTQYYLPASCLEDNNANCELYKKWHRAKYLTLTPTNYTDYDVVLNDMLLVESKIHINKIHYDSYNATQFTLSMVDNGLNCVPFSQTLWNFNQPTKEFERQLLRGKIVLHNNPITRWCISNVELKYDHNGNCKPSKANNVKAGSNKIDGVISMLQALAGTFEQQQQTFIY